MYKSNIIVFLNKLSRAYEGYRGPLCRELGLTPTAFDILMFLANNPEYDTARDITMFRGIKANLVSFTVNRLVEGGYIVREAVSCDRRKVRLKCSGQADAIVERGRRMQAEFSRAATGTMSPEQLAAFESVMSCIEKNITGLL